MAGATAAPPSASVATCRVLEDAAGDATVLGQRVYAIAQQQVDVRAVHISGGKSELAVTIYLSALNDELSADWDVSFRADAAYIFARASSRWVDDPVNERTTYTAWRENRPPLPARGSIDLKAATVTINVPVSVAPEAFTADTVLYEFRASAEMMVRHSQLPFAETKVGMVDEAAGFRTARRDGSCRRL